MNHILTEQDIERIHCTIFKNIIASSGEEYKKIVSCTTTHMVYFEVFQGERVYIALSLDQAVQIYNAIILPTEEEIIFSAAPKEETDQEEET